MKLLFVGDVVGGIGRRTLAALLPEIRDAHEPDFVVVNGENAAGGVGITQKTARELLDLGADAITLGNHAFRHREVYEYLDRERRIVRPANYPKGSPGRGHTVVERDGIRLGVVNLSGLVFLQAVRSPFAEADAALAELGDSADAVLVDMHAEATSETVAMGWHLDGRVTACVGTHTHVPTADARVLPGRHGLRDGRRHDRAARRRHRREARAGAGALPDADERALRDLRRGSMAERRPDRGGRRRPRDRDRAAARGACKARAHRRSSRTLSAITAASAAFRSTTRPTANGSRATTSK